MARKAKVQGAKENAKDFKVGLTVLDEISVEVGDVDPTEEATYGYNLSFTRPAVLPNGDMHFQCLISVTKASVANKDNVVQVNATYSCLVIPTNLSEKQAIVAIRAHALTVLWMQFISLFALISSQMHVSFPDLPPEPAFVDMIEDMDNEDEAVDLEKTVDG